MRKFCIACCYAGGFVGYIFIGMLFFTIGAHLSSITALNNIVASVMVLVFLGLPLWVLLSKKRRRELHASIQALVDHWLAQTWQPLLVNSKRKAFWLLQGYLGLRFLTFLTKAFLLVFVFPVVLSQIDGSKEVFLAIILLCLALFLWNVGKLTKALIDSEFSKTVRPIVSAGILLLMMNSFTIVSHSGDLRFENAIQSVGQWNALVLLIPLSLVFLVLFLQKRLIASLERDLAIDRMSDATRYQFNRYNELLVITTLTTTHEFVCGEETRTTVTVHARLRYGWFPLTLTVEYPRKQVSSPSKPREGVRT